MSEINVESLRLQCETLSAAAESLASVARSFALLAESMMAGLPAPTPPEPVSPLREQIMTMGQNCSLDE